MTADLARIRDDLAWIAVPRDPETAPDGLARVLDRLRAEFAAMGYEVDEQPPSKLALPVPGDGARWPNLLARTRGEGPAYILGAHYDAVPGTPGADDNASAVAALLYVMRRLAGKATRSPVVFAAYSLEEYGFLGSRAHVDALRAAKAEVAGMVSLEMVGFTSERQEYPVGLSWFYPKHGRFIAVVSDWSSRPFLARWTEGMRLADGLDVQTLMVPGGGALVPAVRLSDHSPFWDAGYPALLVTDTSFYRNPHYHQPSDTIPTLDVDFLARVAEGTTRALGRLVGVE